MDVFAVFQLVPGYLAEIVVKELFARQNLVLTVFVINAGDAVILSRMYAFMFPRSSVTVFI